jgi:hypothetical protein
LHPVAITSGWMTMTSTPWRRAHLWEDSLHASDRTEQVGLQHPPPVLHRHLLDRPEVDDGRVVDEQVDVTRSLEGRPHRVVVGDVELLDLERRTGSSGRLQEAWAIGVRVAHRRPNVPPLRSQTQCRGEPDALSNSQ